MTIHVESERQVIQEAAQVLIKHMSPAKATRFLGLLAGRRRRLPCDSRTIAREGNGEIPVQASRAISEKEKQEVISIGVERLRSCLCSVYRGALNGQRYGDCYKIGGTIRNVRGAGYGQL